MKKIPTAFVREYANHQVIGVKNEYTNELCRKAVEEGTATLKIDGACCAIINGDLYKRYDCKKGKVPPEGAIPCCLPDPVTGHWPHWVKVGDGPEDVWFRKAFIKRYTDIDDFILEDIPDGTYEAVGLHFQGNPYNLEYDTLVEHGKYELFIPERNIVRIYEYLRNNYIEGIVFWYAGEPVCKIKRSDFGLEWRNK